MTKKFYDNLIDKCNNLELRFESFFNDAMVHNDIPKSLFEYNITIIQELLFGVDESMPIKKVDCNKNKNLIKQILLNVPNMRDSVNLLSEIIAQLEEFLNFIANSFNKINEDYYKNKATSISNSDEVISFEKHINDYNLTVSEYEKLSRMLYSYAWECTHIRSYCSELRSLIDNSGCLAATSKLLSNINPSDIKNCKKDTLKRYYFTDTYEIKNNIRYFDMNSMIFGETNTIMRLYNIITDFLFKDFLFMYSVIKTNITVLSQKSKK